MVRACCFVMPLNLILLASFGQARDVSPDASQRETSATLMSSGKARAFVLKDQYGKTHIYDFPRRTISVLIFADRTGSEQLEDWIRPIYARYRTDIGIYGVAQLPAVPGFARGLVRAAFRERVQYPVMLDWQGQVSQSYDYQSGQTNLFVIDIHGTIIHTAIGAINASKLQDVLRHIDRLLGMR
jgi:hypothetical protein